MDRQATSKEICSVTVNDVEGGTMALDHLIGRGHERILFINGPLNICQCHDRRVGVLASIERHRLSYQEIQLTELFVPSLTLNFRESTAQTISAEFKLREFTAIVCANDLLALGVIRACSKQGIAIPKDIVLVGYDDITFASMVSPSLTSVRQPQHELGYRAAKLLLEELHDGSHRYRQIRFSPSIVPREST
ncbi:substrate-binding protein-like domain-containing protein [Ferrithrix thermotolerans DSM 19514]|uniref:Substrate-binding protein-like domain-containing protein n=1 Tax=Ferrithrix thermotolerans DSM 19514 TaxID=1121881 RepID=A0A1M4WSN8_9ACTN|nr:substrate-binding protein-like domain-containing protein [Ferrithrix thermotolerans DSM 19514]